MIRCTKCSFGFFQRLRLVQLVDSTCQYMVMSLDTGIAHPQAMESSNWLYTTTTAAAQQVNRVVGWAGSMSAVEHSVCTGLIEAPPPRSQILPLLDR